MFMLGGSTLTLVLGLTVVAWDVGLAEASQSARSISAPVVVELFTSQGCDTCLSISELTDRIAARPDVILLSFHVEYWDYIGWKDSLAIPAATERQRAYSRTLHTRLLYTPQIVVDGTVSVGIRTQAEIDAAIDVMAKHTGKLALRLLRHDDGRVSVLIPAGDSQTPATVWLAFFEREIDTAITAGDNAGRTMRSVNVVRRLIPAGRWVGEALEIPLGADGDEGNGYDGCAVIVQTEPMGPVLGAAAIQLGSMPGR
jgi:hypothetical protein